jgi:hypothetical protein
MQHNHLDRSAGLEVVDTVEGIGLHDTLHGHVMLPPDEIQRVVEEVRGGGRHDDERLFSLARRTGIGVWCVGFNVIVGSGGWVRCNGSWSGAKRVDWRGRGSCCTCFIMQRVRHKDLGVDLHAKETENEC